MSNAELNIPAYGRGWEDGATQCGRPNPHPAGSVEFCEYARGFREGREHREFVKNLKENPRVIPPDKP